MIQHRNMASQALAGTPAQPAYAVLTASESAVIYPPSPRPDDARKPSTIDPAHSQRPAPIDMG